MLDRDLSELNDVIERSLITYITACSARDEREVTIKEILTSIVRGIPELLDQVKRDQEGFLAVAKAVIREVEQRGLFQVEGQGVRLPPHAVLLSLVSDFSEADDELTDEADDELTDEADDELTDELTDEADAEAHAEAHEEMSDESEDYDEEYLPRFITREPYLLEPPSHRASVDLEIIYQDWLKRSDQPLHIQGVELDHIDISSWSRLPPKVIFESCKGGRLDLSIFSWCEGLSIRSCEFKELLIEGDRLAQIDLLSTKASKVSVREVKGLDALTLFDCQITNLKLESIDVDLVMLESSQLNNLSLNEVRCNIGHLNSVFTKTSLVFKKSVFEQMSFTSSIIRKSSFSTGSIGSFESDRSMFFDTQTKRALSVDAMRFEDSLVYTAVWRHTYEGGASDEDASHENASHENAVRYSPQIEISDSLLKNVESFFVGVKDLLLSRCMVFDGSFELKPKDNQVGRLDIEGLHLLRSSRVKGFKSPQLKMDQLSINHLNIQGLSLYELDRTQAETLHRLMSTEDLLATYQALRRGGFVDVSVLKPSYERRQNSSNLYLSSVNIKSLEGIELCLPEVRFNQVKVEERQDEGDSARRDRDDATDRYTKCHVNCSQLTVLKSELRYVLFADPSPASDSPQDSPQGSLQDSLQDPIQDPPQGPDFIENKRWLFRDCALSSAHFKEICLESLEILRTQLAYDVKFDSLHISDLFSLADSFHPNVHPDYSSEDDSEDDGMMLIINQISSRGLSDGSARAQDVQICLDRAQLDHVFIDNCQLSRFDLRRAKINQLSLVSVISESLRLWRPPEDYVYLILEKNFDKKQKQGQMITIPRELLERTPRNLSLTCEKHNFSSNVFHLRTANISLADRDLDMKDVYLIFSEDEYYKDVDRYDLLNFPTMQFNDQMINSIKDEDRVELDLRASNLLIKKLKEKYLPTTISSLQMENCDLPELSENDQEFESFYAANDRALQKKSGYRSKTRPSIEELEINACSILNRGLSSLQYGSVKIGGASVIGSECFKGALFKEDVILDNVWVTGEGTFKAARFEADVTFSDCLFLSNAAETFDLIDAREKLSFNNPTIFGALSFRSAQIQESLNINDLNLATRQEELELLRDFLETEHFTSTLPEGLFGIDLRGALLERALSVINPNIEEMTTSTSFFLNLDHCAVKKVIDLSGLYKTMRGQKDQRKDQSVIEFTPYLSLRGVSYDELLIRPLATHSVIHGQIAYAPLAELPTLSGSPTPAQTSLNLAHMYRNLSSASEKKGRAREWRYYNHFYIKSLLRAAWRALGIKKIVTHVLYWYQLDIHNKVGRLSKRKLGGKLLILSVLSFAVHLSLESSFTPEVIQNHLFSSTIQAWLGPLFGLFSITIEGFDKTTSFAHQLIYGAQCFFSILLFSPLIQNGPQIMSSDAVESELERLLSEDQRDH